MQLFMIWIFLATFRSQAAIPVGDGSGPGPAAAAPADAGTLDESFRRLRSLGAAVGGIESACGSHANRDDCLRQCHAPLFRSLEALQSRMASAARRDRLTASAAAQVCPELASDAHIRSQAAVLGGAAAVSGCLARAQAMRRRFAEAVAEEARRCGESSRQASCGPFGLAAQQQAAQLGCAEVRRGASQGAEERRRDEERNRAAALLSEERRRRLSENSDITGGDDPRAPQLPAMGAPGGGASATESPLAASLSGQGNPEPTAVTEKMPASGTSPRPTPAAPGPGPADETGKTEPLKSAAASPSHGAAAGHARPDAKRTAALEDPTISSRSVAALQKGAAGAARRPSDPERGTTETELPLMEQEKTEGIAALESNLGGGMRSTGDLKPGGIDAYLDKATREEFRKELGLEPEAGVALPTDGTAEDPYTDLFHRVRDRYVQLLQAGRLERTVPEQWAQASLSGN